MARLYALVASALLFACCPQGLYAQGSQSSSTSKKSFAALGGGGTLEGMPVPKNTLTNKEVTSGSQTEQAPPQTNGATASVGGKDTCTAFPTEPRSGKATGRMPPNTGGKRPNVIVILTDDQGYDDLGIHQYRANGRKPDYIQTPNMDKFIRSSTEFNNFYVTPMCAQTRAQLLSGRNFAKTGTLLVDSGWDFMNKAETNIAEVMNAAGYKTAHFGKWHNGFALGYEPWNVGFDYAIEPQAHIHLDNIMRFNGKYVQTHGLMEEVLMDNIIKYLDQHKANPDKPFFMYYALHAIHQGFMRPNQGPRWQRPSPPAYQQKSAKFTQLNSDTRQVFAMANYMDDVLGRLFDYLEKNDMYKDTYVMLLSDNGSELFPREQPPKAKAVRMPSMMQGYKRSAYDGGWRTYMAVRGPNVLEGRIDNTLTGVADILPTVVELAGGSPAQHLPWDGTSLASLFRGSSADPAAGRFLATFDQEKCIDLDFLPLLGPDRMPLKPQPLLDYYKGGETGEGFERCMGVRMGQYKWVGYKPLALYKFVNGSHVELPCNEVARNSAEYARVHPLMRAAGERWWNQVLASPHSFVRASSYLGVKQWRITNVLGNMAVERTPGRVVITDYKGLKGFSAAGDKAYWKLNVQKAGHYEVDLVYTSHQVARVALSIGTYKHIQAGTAARVALQIPKQGSLKMFKVGVFNLPLGDQWEVAVELLSSQDGYGPVFSQLDNIRFNFLGPANRPQRVRPAGTRRGAVAARESAFVPNSALKAAQEDGSLSEDTPVPLFETAASEPAAEVEQLEELAQVNCTSVDHDIDFDNFHSDLMKQEAADLLKHCQPLESLWADTNAVDRDM